MIQTFEQFNKLYEGDNQEMIDNKENDNIIKDVILYNDFPKDEDKCDRSWEEAIQIIRDSKYNVKCALLGTDKYTRYDWSAPYEFKHKNKTYRYRKSIHRNDSIINERGNGYKKLYKIDFQQFVTDESYAQDMIKRYDIIKSFLLDK